MTEGELPKADLPTRTLLSSTIQSTSEVWCSFQTVIGDGDSGFTFWSIYCRVSISNINLHPLVFTSMGFLTIEVTGFCTVETPLISRDRTKHINTTPFGKFLTTGQKTVATLSPTDQRSDIRSLQYSTSLNTIIIPSDSAFRSPPWGSDQQPQSVEITQEIRYHGLAYTYQFQFSLRL